MLKQGIGFVALCAGAMGGDSEVLWLSFLLIAIGAWLIISGEETSR